MTGPKELPELYQERFRLDNREKVFHPEGVWALEWAPQESGQCTKTDSVQGMFGQCSRACDEIFEANLCSSRSWILMVLAGPFHLKIFYDSKI